MSELSHSVSVKRGPMMKAFINVYEISPRHSNITTCHLFWGFLFLVPAFVLKMIAVPIFALIDRQQEKRSAARFAAYDAQPDTTEEDTQVPEHKDSWMLSTLKNMASFFGATWFKLQPALPWIGRGLGVLFALGLVALIMLFPLSAIKFVLIILASIAAGALVMGIVWAVLTLAEKADAGRAFKKAAHSVHDHTCATVEFKN